MKKLLRFGIVLAFVTLASSQNWINHAKFRGFNTYFQNLMQHFVYEIEDYGWWNLRLSDKNNTINQQIYDRHFIGIVNYTNGFLVGVDHIDISNMAQSFIHWDVSYPITGSMATAMKFHHVQLGYDVHAHFGELGEYRFTGIYTHPNAEFEIRLTKDFNTNVITPFCMLTNLATDTGLFMEYLPHTDIAEVIQRYYTAASSGVGNWCTNVFNPLLRKLTADDHLPFPEICFNC